MSQTDEENKFDISDLASQSPNDDIDFLRQQLDAVMQEASSVRKEAQEDMHENQLLKERNLVLQKKIDSMKQEHENRIQNLTNVAKNQIEIRDTTINKLNNEIQKLNDSNKRKMSSIMQQNSEIQKSLDKNNATIQEFQNKMQRFFNVQFNSLDEIANFIESKFDELSDKTDNNIDMVQYVPITKYEKLQNEYQAANNKIFELNTQLQTTREAFNDFETRIESAEKKMQADELNYTKEITGVKNERDKLQMQVDQLKKTIEDNLKSIESLDKIKENQNKEIMELRAVNLESDNAILKAKDKIGKLQEAIVDFKRDNKFKSDQIDDLKAKLVDCQNQIDLMAMEKNYLQRAVEELNKEKEETAEQINILTKGNSEQKDKISSLETLVQELKNSLSQLSTEKSDISNNINILKSKLEQKASAIQNLENNNKSLQDEMNKLANDKQNEINKIKEENQRKLDDITKKLNIPASTWEILGVPQDLNYSLRQISSNESLQLPAKISSSLQTVSDYMKRQKNDESESIIVSLNEKVDGLRNMVSLLSQIKTDRTVDYDDLANNEKVQKEFVESIKSNFEKIQELQKQRDAMESLIKDVMSSIGAKKPSEIPEILNNSIHNSEEMKEIINELHDKNRKLKSDIAQLINSLEQLNSEKLNLQNSSKTMKDQVSNTNQEIHKKNIEIEKLNGEIESQKNAFEMRLKDSIEKVNKENIERMKKFVTDIEQLKELINDKETQINGLQSKISDLRQERKKLRAALTQQEAVNNETIAALETEKEAKSQADRENAMNQLNDLKTFYENVLSEMKKKNNELQTNLDNTNNQLKDSKSAESKLLDIKQKLEDKLNLASGAFEQLKKKYNDAKKNSDLREKAQKMLISNEMNTKLQNMKAQYEIDTRKFFTDVVMQLMMFYDTNELPSYDVCMKVVAKAKESITKLSTEIQTVRSLLGITDNESLEKALQTVLTK